MSSPEHGFCKCSSNEPTSGRRCHSSNSDQFHAKACAFPLKPCQVARGGRRVETRALPRLFIKGGLREAPTHGGPGRTAGADAVLCSGVGARDPECRHPGTRAAPRLPETTHAEPSPGPGHGATGGGAKCSATAANSEGAPLSRAMRPDCAYGSAVLAGTARIPAP